ncbi:rubredoxin domain-containing protein [Fulvivirga sp. M361]|nr:rubredoxin domain-containing protein [Fulvivirga sp. M361]
MRDRKSTSKPVKFKDIIRVFVKGGIISPGDLLKIIYVAERLGAGYLHIGSRQDILFPATEKDGELLNKTFGAIDMEYEVNDFVYQNISSSYVSLDLQPSKKWLGSDEYHYILESFSYRPRLRINIVDPSQSLVPLFTGNINFLAANLENFWYLYLRFNEIQSAPWQVPLLIYGEDIAKVSRHLEELNIVENNIPYQEVTQRLEETNAYTQPVTEELIFPDTNFPYYEGINRMPDGKYWLGLYWRDNHFNFNILKDICQRCLQTEVGKISLTPWKSLVIKDIFETDRIGWEKLLGKAGMNLRHSALELNWHLPALDEEALELKTQLVRTLDQQDISTYGLTFTVKTSHDITPFTSIVIEKSTEQEDSYNILYSRDFNPNLMEYQYYAENMPREVIASLLIELSHIYYEQLDEYIAGDKPMDLDVRLPGFKLLYECKSCLTQYDQEFGEEAQDIAKNTPFEALPEQYHCPLCNAPKSNFQRVK